MIRLRTFALISFLLFLVVLTANAQVAGRVTGTVVDASGAAIPEATVNLQLPGSTAAMFTAKTTAAGDFTIAAVPANTYDLVVEARGFQRSQVNGLIVTTGRATDVPSIKLDVSGVVSTVEVSSSQTSVETSNAEVSTTIARSQIANLPVLNRSPLAFLTTQAGINYGAGSTTVNGQRPTYTNVTIDGINIQDNYIRTNDMDFLPNLLLLNQVAEVTVSTSNANSAASGGSSQVQFVTPSGGNSFHGSGYWSNRNNYFAANTWFNNKSGTRIPFLNQNQPGMNISGPVLKDKLFFYANYEAFRLKQQTTVSTTVLTDDARKGIFTYKDTGGNIVKKDVLSLMSQSIDPTMAAILAKVPAASGINNYDVGDSTAAFVRNTAGYRYNIRNNRTRDNLTLKGDYQMSPRNAFRLTYMWNRDVLDRPDVATTFDLAPSVQNDNATKLMSFTWRTNPTSSLTNEARFGFNWAPAIFLASQDVPKFYIAPALITNPINTFRTQGRNTDTYNFADNAGWVHGAHTLQFGYQQQNVRIETFNDAGITPSFTNGIGGNTALTNVQLPGISSTDLGRANNLLTLFAGYISAYTQTYNVSTRNSGFVNGYTNTRHILNDNFAGYVNDSWKLSRRLTLTAGVRWDYWAPIDERDGLYLMPVMTNNDPIATVFNSNASLDFAGGPSGRLLYKKDRNNFAPNLGLAWDPTGAGKWVVRAGYSLAYVNDNLVQAVNNSLGTNAGLQSAVTGSGLTARVSNLPAITPPTYKVPRTLADNYVSSATSAMAFPSPDLVTPYVQQWNIDVQRTIKSTLIDVRYVGNHQTKAIRAFDYNQVVINQLLPDFLKAQSNGFLAVKAGQGFLPAYNANIAGSQVLNFLPQLPNGGRLTDANVISALQTGQVGELANYYQTGRFNGSFNFYKNPNILGGNVLTNYSNASYNGLQLDVAHRLSHGVQIQANYVFSRILGDAQGDQQTNFEPFLDINNAKIERSRTSASDNTHVLKANGSWALPFGKNRFFHSSNPVVSKFMEGWNVAGIYTNQSGNAFGIYSNRGTLNRQGRSAFNTMNTNLTKGQLDQFWSFRMTGNGPVFVPNSAKNPIDGSAVAADGAAPFNGQVFSMPAAGTLGSLQRNYFSGPWVWNLDFSASKITHITENQTIELRMMAVNVFNHPTFGSPVTTPTATNFGAITSTFNPGGNSRRLVQFELKYQF